jgi:hypothetical protein
MRTKWLPSLCRILLFSAVIFLLWSTERTFADSFSIIHQSGQVITTAASNPIDEEDPALVYEATKLLQAAGTPQDVDMSNRWFFPIGQIGRAFHS